MVWSANSSSQELQSDPSFRVMRVSTTTPMPPDGRRSTEFGQEIALAKVEMAKVDAHPVMAGVYPHRAQTRRIELWPAWCYLSGFTPEGHRAHAEAARETVVVCGRGRCQNADRAQRRCPSVVRCTCAQSDKLARSAPRQQSWDERSARRRERGARLSAVEPNTGPPPKARRPQDDEARSRRWRARGSPPPGFPPTSGHRSMPTVRARPADPVAAAPGNLPTEDFSRYAEIGSVQRPAGNVIA
jgi:hypothetical protein